MTARIPIASVLVLGLLAIVLFFAYHIVLASKHDTNSIINHDLPVQPHNEPVQQPVFQAPKHDIAVMSEPLDHAPQPPVPMPVVPAQTEEDLRETRPISQTPPDVVYAEPEPQDPAEGAVNMEAEFGDNLRHPEQMIEVAPPMGSMRVPAAGIGNERTDVGPHQPNVYSPEMAQNGSEFMKGIVAFEPDLAGGIGYSTI